MRRIVVATTLSLLALAASAAPALAHERRTVGPYTFVVGFLGEPTFTAVPNAVDLRVSETAANKPVEGLQDTLQVEISAAGQKKTYQLRARFGQPGAYAADFVPTRTSTYVFRFFGKVGDRSVDERFESGPGRFEEPESIVDAQFPPGDETTSRLADIQSAVGQTRLLAIFALLVAIGGVGAALWRRRT